MATLRELVGNGSQLDMLISNFVYEKEGAKHKKVMKYTSAIERKLFTWKDVQHFFKGTVYFDAFGYLPDTAFERLWIRIAKAYVLCG